MARGFSWSVRRRWAAGVLVACSLALVTLVTAATLDGLVFYRTTTEAVAEGPGEQTLRVGGMVLAGSVVRDEASSRLVLTDGATDIEVAYTGMLPALIQEGEGAVVEGRWEASGRVFEATGILLRHSNEYGPAEDADQP